MEQVINFIDKYQLLINLGFYLIISIPILYGLIDGLNRGFKGGMWRFIKKAIFYLVFIFTLDLICNAIYNSDLFGLGNYLYTTVFKESTTEIITMKDFAETFMLKYLSQYESTVGSEINGEYVLALIDMVGLFAVKIVWIIIYFTIIRLLYAIIMAIIFAIFFKGKEEFRSIEKYPLLGGVTGLLSGCLSAFLLMVFLTGIFSLIQYTGELSKVTSGTESAEEVNANSNNGYENIEFNEDGSSIIKLEESEGESEGSSSGSSSDESLKDVIKIVEQVQMGAQALSTVTNLWNNNLFVKGANSVYIPKSTGNVDGEGNETKVNTPVLTATFDTLVSMSYKVEGAEGEKSVYAVSVNFISELNSLVNAVLYIVDDKDIINKDGSVDFSKLDPERVEKGFAHLSEINLFKVVLSVGLGSFASQFMISDDMTDTQKNEIIAAMNSLARKDYSSDLAGLGKVLSGLIELGLGGMINNFVGGDVPEQSELINSFLVGVTGIKGESESEEAFQTRINTIRKKVTDSVKEIKILQDASKALLSLATNKLLKEMVTKYELDDVSLNKVTGNATTDTYISNLVNNMNISSDLSVVFDILFDIADFNGDDSNINFLMENYESLAEAISAEGSSLTLDDIANFLNTVLADLSKFTSVNSILDILIKIVTVNIESSSDNPLKDYLTEQNIFGTDGIAWNEEIGNKIPNLVTALVKADILSIITNTDGITNILWEKGTSELGLKGYLNDTIEALFSIKLISNLEDTCLSDLLSTYLTSLDIGITIVVSDELGDENHKYKDEILNLLGLLDDVLKGAKEKGATSIEDVFSGEMKYLLGGVSNLDAKKLEASSILGPTIVSFLSSNSVEQLKAPYIFEDPIWYSTYNEDGSYKTKGEIALIVDGIKVLVDNDTLISMITDGTGDSSALISSIKSISTSDIEKLFSSATIRYTVTSLLDSLGGDGFTLVVTSEAKSDQVLSNYEVDEDGNLVDKTLSYTGETLKDASGNEILVNGEAVKLVNASLISIAEMKSIILALHQLPDDVALDELLDSEDIISTIKNSLSGAGLNEDGSAVTTGETKYEIMFKSSILRCTVSYFLTGDDFSNYFDYPVAALEIIDGDYYITRAEFKSLFDAVMVVLNNTDLSNLDNISFENFKDLADLTDDELDTLSSSIILNATITSKLGTAFGDGSQSILIPLSSTVESSRVKNTGTEENITLEVINTYRDLSPEEIQVLIKSVGYFDFEKLGNADTAFDSIKTLTDEVEPGKTKLDVILSSGILVSTMSDIVLNMNLDSLTLIVPYIALEDEKVEIYVENGENTLNYNIKKSEIKTLVEDLNIVDLSTIGDVDTAFDSIKSFTTEKVSDGSKTKLEAILESYILHATISNILLTMDLGSGSDQLELIVPYIAFMQEGGSPVQLDIYTTDNSVKKNYVIDKTEMFKLVDSLNYLDFEAIANTDSAFDSIKSFTTEKTSDGSKTKLEAILESDILFATISNILLTMDLGSGSDQLELIVPYIAFMQEAGEPVKLDIYTKDNSIKKNYVIDKTEMFKLVDSLNYLDFETISNTDSAFDSIKSFTTEKISDGSKTKLEAILESNILYATISNILLTMDLGSGSDQLELIVPYIAFMQEAGEPVKLDIYTIDNSIKKNYVIDKTEMFKLVDSLNYLDFSAIANSDSAFDSIKSFTTEKTSDGSKTKLEAILESNILYATLSNIVLTMDLSSGSDSLSLVVPSSALAASAGNPIQLDIYTTDSSVKKNYVLDKTEMFTLVNSLNYLDFSAIANSDSAFDSIKKLSKEKVHGTTETKLEAVLDSNILMATISNVMMNMDLESLSLIVTEDAIDEEGFTIYKNNTLVSEGKCILKESEVILLINALNYLDLSQFSGSDNVFNALKSLVEPATLSNSSVLKINKILESSILHATISNYISTMSLSALPIMIPSTAFESEVLINYVDKYDYSATAQDKVYLITETELTNFIIAAGSLDLDKLTSNPTGSLTSLSKKVRIGATNKMAIEYINDSQILKASMSNYIVSKSSDLGFSQVKFPTDVLESTLVYDISVSSYLVSKTESYSVNIGSTELKNFTIALGFIDLTNIASDTLGAISGLNEGATGYVGRTKLSLLLDSEIITYTLSTQLVDTAGKDGSTVFYIPKQSFVLDGANLKANDVYSSFNSTTGVISKSSQYLINSTEIEKLISTLSIIDLNNVDANKILSLPADDLDSLLSSNIILANISEKFWSALSGNANVSDGLNDYMKSEDLLYSTTNNFTSFTSESITKDEITNIFNAIRILGVKDMSTFDINFQSLFLLKDNGDNEDDDTQAVGVESRVDFLRSIFIRTYLTNSDSLGAASLAFQAKALDTNNLEQEAGTGSEKAYLKIKVFSDTFDNDVYGDVLYTAPSSLDLTLTDLTLTWNAPTYTGSNLHIITYYIYLNGTNLAGDTGTTSTSFTFPSGTFDQVDEYVIAVTAQVVETIVIPPSAKISKPVVYNEYTKETEGALSSFVGVSESDMTISFYLLPNANEYVFEFTDELSNVISTTVRKEYSSGNKLERNFKDILVAGHTYSYRITAKSNNSSYSDSVYNSTSNIEYEAENEAFDVEYDEDDLIYFTNLDYQDSSFTYVYTIRIGSTDYNYDPSDDTSDLYSAISVAEYYYTIDLSKIEDKLSSGSVTITITSVKDYYANSSSSVTVICIKDSDIAFSYANNKATFTDSALLSDVLMVEVFNSESQSIIYKEMNIDSTNKNYVLDLSSLDAGEYTISYTPTNSSNNYYSFTKVSSAVSVVEASE